MEKKQEHAWLRELVLAVNELFHNIEGERYIGVHPEIFVDEPRRWKRHLQAFIHHQDEKRVFLDLGSGTGFVGGNWRLFSIIMIALFMQTFLKQC